MSAPPVSWRRGAWLLLLPLVFGAAAISLECARGPLWLGGNSDPSYQYLLNSLLVLQGHPPCHIDHPGTTVQTIGAAVLRLTTPGGDNDERTLAVLADPEGALRRLHHCFLGLSLGALALAGLFVLARTGSLALAGAVQLVPVLRLGTYRATLFVDPEALLVPVTLLFVALLLVREHVPDSASARRTRLLLDLALGLLAGAGLVTKVTFAPLCLLPLLVQRSWRAALGVAGIMLVGSLVYLAPALSQLPRMWQWFERLATHTGTYGSGSTGFIDAGTYLANVWTLATADRLLLLLLPLSVVVGVAILRTHPTDPRILRRARLLLLAAAVQGVGVLLVAKHPHPRYLLPVVLSTTFNAALLVELAAGWPRPTDARRACIALLMLAVVAAALLGRDVIQLTHDLEISRAAQHEHSRRADTLAAQGATRVDYYRSSSPEFALHFGNGTAWRLYAAPLARLHPNRFFFNLFTGRFERFSGPIAPEEVLRGGPILLVGSGGIDRLPPGIRLPIPLGWTLSLVERHGDHTIHRLQPTP